GDWSSDVCSSDLVPVFVIGVTGVTMLIEIGTLTTCETLGRALLVVSGESVTMIVDVNVPFGRFDGSNVTCNVMPSGARMPFDGVMTTHGSSDVATKLNVPSGWPGMKTSCVTV